MIFEQYKMQSKLINRRQSSHIVPVKPTHISTVRYLSSATETCEELTGQKTASASLGLSPTKVSKAKDWWMDERNKHVM